MIVPGAGLLGEAFALIGTQPIQYAQATNRILNAVGQWVTTYAPPITLQVSVQAVNRNKYAEQGLDLAKTYINVYARADVLSVDRDLSGDQIFWKGVKYQVPSNKDWFAQDGWVQITAVKV
jgi:hypothetical protein